MANTVPFIVGYASVQSHLSLEEVAELFSGKIFGGLAFGGKDLEIYEEVPAVFLDMPILGLRVVLSGYSGFEEDQNYTLSVSPWFNFDYAMQVDVRIDSYLTCLFNEVLKDMEDVKVLF